MIEAQKYPQNLGNGKYSCVGIKSVFYSVYIDLSPSRENNDNNNRLLFLEGNTFSYKTNLLRDPLIKI